MKYRIDKKKVGLLGLDLKVFQINQGGERTYVGAYTNIQALAIYKEHYPDEFDELDPTDSIVELTKEQCENITLTNHDFDEDDPDSDPENFSLQWWLENYQADEIIGGTMSS